MFKSSNFKYFYPTLSESWILVLVFVFLGSLVGGVGALLVKNTALSTSISYILTMIPPFWYIAAKAKKNANPVLEAPTYVWIDKPHFGKLGALPLFVLLAFAVWALSIVTEPLVSWIPMPDLIKEAFDAAFDASKPVDLIVSTAILAPICEELLCRGNMMRGILVQKGVVKAILWSAFIFALIHFNPWQAIPAFILGCFFGWIYYKTHSIWACIFMHFVNNATSAALTLLLPDMGANETLSSVMGKGTYAVVYFSALAILCAIIYLLYKKLDSYDKVASFEVQCDPQEPGLGGEKADDSL
ncbi:MAG: CPBP family intramembrane metalloprotease [Bacteroidales bacterium]|nr:CPBP family intramembrane metalloprotease [Bacteroidales bacterium]MBO7479655.1 CPBP family intramembrane metalloprotease [Bacteroidales bacterium]MBO7487684.1 CPBP family intramembrane metalloprotease [Bacteroidales bacterium]